MKTILHVRLHVGFIKIKDTFTRQKKIIDEVKTLFFLEVSWAITMIYEPQSSINRKHLQNFHIRLLGTVLEKTITSVMPRYIADFATPLVLCWKTKSLTPTKLIGWVALASQMQCAQVVLTYPNLVYFTLPLQRTEILSIYFDYKLRIYLLATTTDMLCKILFL